MIDAIYGMGGFVLLSFLRFPVWLSMAIAGFVGFTYKVGLQPAFSMLAQVTYETSLTYALSVIPLFVLMGNFIVRARLSEELFHAAYTFTGHRRGGLAQSTIIASAAFGSVCGSSVATTATFSKVAYPPMRAKNYKSTLAAGSIASGGTLGLLIPPSTVYVIYGIMTEVNIGKLFIAAIIPGVLGTMLLCCAVAWVCWRDKAAGPVGDPYTWRARISSVKKVWPVVVLFGSVIGGIYGGIFTAMEGAGIGAGGAFLLALAKGGLNWRILYVVLLDSARTTATIFVLVIGAMIFVSFMNYTTAPTEMADYVMSLDRHPLLVVAAICFIYVLLGCAMEELSMILLTVPVFFPIIVALGFDPLWFGVLIAIVVQIGLISPPVGMNLFVIRNLIGKISTWDIFKGVIPFNVALIVLLIIMLAFPELATYLPGKMK